MITIKVLRKNEELLLPKIIDKGEWIDLRLSHEVSFKAPYANMLKKKTVNGVETRTRDIVFDVKLLDLGVAMELPKGFEAQILPRSSTFNKYGLTLLNSEGIIDNPYKGENDEWKCNVMGFKTVTIPEGERLFQFKIELSQKATRMDKLKWLMSNGIRIVEVDHLDNANRNGFGEGTKDIA